MSDLVIQPVEDSDAAAVSNLFAQTFTDLSWGPYGPGGHYIVCLWPNLTTAQGQEHARARYANIISASRAVDPDLIVKVVDQANGALAGFILLDEIDRPRKDGIASTVPNAAHYDSKEAYESLLRLREDRDEVCWRGVKLLPEEPVINLKLLAVDPRYQRRGVGSMLIRHATKRADDRKANMFVHATPIQASIKAYEKHGFVMVADDTVPFRNGDDEPNVPTTRIPVLLRRRDGLA